MDLELIFFLGWGEVHLIFYKAIFNSTSYIDLSFHCRSLDSLKILKISVCDMKICMQCLSFDSYFFLCYADFTLKGTSYTLVDFLPR